MAQHIKNTGELFIEKYRDNEADEHRISNKFHGCDGMAVQRVHAFSPNRKIKDSYNVHYGGRHFQEHKHQHLSLSGNISLKTVKDNPDMRDLISRLNISTRLNNSF